MLLWMRLRTSLFLLLLATAIPLVGFAALLSGVLLERRYDTFVTAVKDRNRAFMTAVDAEVSGHISTLEALAVLPSLQRGDLKGFHGVAKAALASQPAWLNLILQDLDGRQVVNTLVPPGTPLAQKPTQPNSLAVAISTKRPVVGQLLPRGPYLDRPGIPVRVPVLRNGEAVYVLSAVLKPESFDRLFELQGIPSGWASGLVDANGLFIARIPERPRGSRASEGFLAAVKSAKEGWYRGSTVDGIDTYTAFTVSPFTGWSVGFAIPASEVIGPVRQAAAIAGGGLLLVLVLAMAFALALSRRISRPMAQLAAAADRLGRTDAVAFTGTRIREVAELEQALNAASAAILARDQELRRRAGELQAADAQKSQFLALLSHELRNPLAPLLTGLTLLKLRADPETTARTHGMMERQIGNLRRLIDDLLDVSRIDRGKLELRTQFVAAEAVVRQAIETARPAIDAKQHQLVVRFSREPLYVDADPVRLGQVVANLLNNAAKFTLPKGRIEIETREEGGEVLIRVRDSGIGFAPGDAARIFDSFVQLDTTHAGGGLGLGLTLVRALVGMHGGTVHAHSDGPGRGAQFTVHLPLVSATPAEAPAKPAAGSPAKMRRRVLVVDDNVDAADSLAALLAVDGFDVRKSYAGAYGLALAREFHPEVAFLDLNMPGMTGLELARALRADASLRGLRLIALTGMGQKADIEATRAAGFDSHLTKPATADDIRREATAA